jgi:hypothetical protein
MSPGEHIASFLGWGLVDGRGPDLWGNFGLELGGQLRFNVHRQEQEAQCGNVARNGAFALFDPFAGLLKGVLTAEQGDADTGFARLGSALTVVFGARTFKGDETELWGLLAIECKTSFNIIGVEGGGLAVVR